MEKKIQEALEQIRPFLQRDGGDVEFVELTEDNIVKVRASNPYKNEVRGIS